MNLIDRILGELWILKGIIETEINNARIQRIQNRIRKKAEQNGKRIKEKV